MFKCSRIAKTSVQIFGSSCIIWIPNGKENTSPFVHFCDLYIQQLFFELFMNAKFQKFLLILQQISEFKSNLAKCFTHFLYNFWITSFTKIKLTHSQAVSILELQKNMFFSNHVFYAKKKVFFIEKNSFLMFFLFFSITGRYLINYSAIRVYL